MSFSRTLAAVLLLILTAALLSITGCQSRAASAQKLFEKGKYEQVFKQYPDLEIALRARAKLAEKLLQEKQYTVVLSQYADTRAAYQARIELANQGLQEGKYQMVIDSFPETPAAKTAKEKLADSLYQAGKYDELIARFGDTPQATQVKEKLATEALADAKKLKGDAKKKALEELMRKYSGTAAYKEAAGILSDIRQKETSKKK